MASPISKEGVLAKGKYKYPRLSKEDAIRLIKLYPAITSIEPQELHGELIEVSLSEVPHYEAASYTWGAPIFLAHLFCPTGAIWITENLREALLRFRLADQLRYLWVDAICIDQDNVLERKHQVGMIGGIYKQADQVLAWIGKSNEDTAGSFAFLEQVGAASRALSMQDSWFHGLTDQKPEAEVDAVKKAFEDSSQLLRLASSFNRPWFQRRWVVQEVVLSRKTIIHCGEPTIDWDSMAVAVTFLQNMDKARQIAAEAISKTSPVMLIRSATNRTHEPGMTPVSFITMLMRLQDYGCQEERDIIYALLNIGESQEGMHVVPDYSKSLAQVFQAFAKRCFKLSPERLQILHYCQQRSSTNSLGLPSWAPDWRTCRPRGVMLGGTGDWWVFSAGKNLHWIAPFTELPNIIVLNGVFVEDIHVVLGGSKDATLTAAVWQLAVIGSSMAISRLPNSCCTGESFISAFGRTLVFDERSPMVPAEEDLPELSSPAAAYHANALDATKTRFTQSMQSLTAYLAYVRRALEYRAFFLTTNGLMGLGPHDMVEGDKIYIFAKGETPFILRKQESGFSVVGECYVHGLMDGQIAQPVQNGLMKDEPVMLV